MLIVFSVVSQHRWAEQSLADDGANHQSLYCFRYLPLSSKVWVGECQHLCTDTAELTSYHNMIKFPLLPRDSWLGDRKVIWPVKKLVWKFWCGTNGRRRPTGWIWKMAEKIDMGWYRLKIVSAFNEICNFFYHYVMYGYNRSTRCFWPLWRVAGKRILLVCAWLQLLRSYDKKEDCDLWKDGMFRAKNLRYICISRDPEVNTFVCHHLMCFYDHAHT